MFYVDIPLEEGEEWRNVATFNTRKEAIEYAQKQFGADKNGKVSLVSGQKED